MNSDPFKNFKPLNNARIQAKKTVATGDSFVEQIKSIGSSVSDSLKTDVVKGMGNTIFDQLMNAGKTGQAPDQKDPGFDFAKWMEGREKQVAEQAKGEERNIQAHKHSQEKVLFSFADEKLSREINDVRSEMAMLVRAMGKVEKQVENAIMENVVDAGVYHLNFFRNLKTWLQFMRKSMEDASAWLQMSSGRGKQKSHYWGQVAKSGTKYSMSSERNVQMGAG